MVRWFKSTGAVIKHRGHIQGRHTIGGGGLAEVNSLTTVEGTKTIIPVYFRWQGSLFSHFNLSRCRLSFENFLLIIGSFHPPINAGMFCLVYGLLRNVSHMGYRQCDRLPILYLGHVFIRKIYGVMEAEGTVKATEIVEITAQRQERLSCFDDSL